MLDYNEETPNHELKKMCNDLGITVEAKVKGKPNKAELIAALDAYEGDGVIEEELSAEELAELKAAGSLKDEKTPEAKTAANKVSKAKQLKLEKTALIRVQVTSNDPEDTREVKFITWGDDQIGHLTDRLLMNRAWHIRKGALENLKAAVHYKSVPNAETGEPETIEIPKYNIIELTPLSKAEIDKLAKKQAVRNAAVGED